MQFKFSSPAVALFLALAAPAFIRAEDAAAGLPVRGLKFSPDSKHLAAAMGTKASGALVVWKTDGWKPVLRHVEAAACTALCFSPDGERIAFATATRRAGILEFPSGKALRDWDAHGEKETVQAVAYAPDGKTLATGGSDGKAHLWDAAEGSLRRTLIGNGQAVMGLAFSPDGRRVLTGGADLTARLWDAGTGELQFPFWTEPSYVGRVGFSRDGKWFFAAGGSVRIRETATGNIRTVVGRRAHDADLSPDGRLLAVVEEEIVQVFPIDLRAPDSKRATRIAALIKQFENDDYALREAASREVEQIGMMAEPQLREGLKSPHAEVRIRCRVARRAVISPKLAAVLASERSDAAAVCFSPDGKFLAGGFRNGDIKVWKVDKFEEVTTLRAAAAK